MLGCNQEHALAAHGSAERGRVDQPRGPRITERLECVDDLLKVRRGAVVRFVDPRNVLQQNLRGVPEKEGDACDEGGVGQMSEQIVDVVGMRGRLMGGRDLHTVAQSHTRARMLR